MVDKEDIITIALIGLNVMCLIASCVTQVWVNNGLNLAPTIMTLLAWIIFAFFISVLVVILIDRAEKNNTTLIN